VTLRRALVYFLREAAVSLVRSWKVSLLAVLTIAVSLFIGGAFLLVSANLAASLDRWSAEMRVVIYLRPDTSEADLRRLAAEAARGPGVSSVEPVTAAAARKRFEEIFPGLSDLVAGWQDEPLPASLEVGLDGGRKAQPAAARAAWIDGWRKRPEVTMVDDDREWLSQLETLVAVVRAVGLALVGGLLGAAIFTIASVIRLTAFLHHEEIAVMRLVGATEFFIRGPFYAEGLLQGLIGGLAASGSLYGVFQAIHARRSSLFSSVLALEFLDGRQVAFLVLLGGAAGLFGAVASLRKEAL
jgi:cell division transport system permease protein